MSASVVQIDVATPGRGFTDLTAKLQQAVGEQSIENGVCNVFIRHTSASLIIQENADPDVRHDLETFLSELVPDGDQRYRHQDEGPDDMPAHVRSVLTATSLNVPVRGGRLALGTWQAVYLWEHRHGPHRRRVELTVLG